MGLFKKIRLFFLLGFAFQLSGCASLSAQQEVDKEDGAIYKIEQSPILFAADKLGQSYVLIEPNELIQYSNRGKEFFRYNNNYLGDLHQIDATNPFSLLLFYKDFSTIITLDRTLSQTSEVNLLDLDLVDVNAVGVSNDNNVWVYDPVAFRLKKISRVGKIIYESDPLSLIFDQPLEVNFILERGNQVFLNDPQQGVYIFDLYGRYLRKIDLLGLKEFQIIEDRIIFRTASAEGVKGNKMYSFHLKTLNEQELQLAKALKEGEQLFLLPDRFFIVRSDEVVSFQMGTN